MAKKQRTIAVVTGSRAEFGLLETVMRAVCDHGSYVSGAGGLALRTIVTGAHLTSGSWRDVTKAGFTIDAKARMQVKGSSGRAADVAALGRGVTGIGTTLDELKPDVVVVLGDRIEAFAGACAAAVGGTHLAHIHGGDRAEGVADEAMRHAISKLAHVHFAATANSRRRLIRMGESPRWIWNVGSPAVDGLGAVAPASDAPDLIVMQHPIGADDKQERQWMGQTLKATAGWRRLVMAPNSDPGRDGIHQAIVDHGADMIDHLPRGRFLALLAGARAIVGNSSAGLIEAAVLKKPCVNVGPRQAGRDKPANVIDCDYGQRSVKIAVKTAIKQDLRQMRHPYGKGDTGKLITDILANLPLDRIPIHKRNAY